MITTPKPQGKQVSFSGGPQFKISVSRVGGFYVFSVTEFDAGEVKFEVFDNHSHSIHTEDRASINGSISITWEAKLEAGVYKLSVTASKYGKQITETKSFTVE